MSKETKRRETLTRQVCKILESKQMQNASTWANAEAITDLFLRELAPSPSVAAASEGQQGCFYCRNTHNFGGVCGCACHERAALRGNAVAGSDTTQTGERFYEWVEPFGPNSEPVTCRVSEATAIATQRAAALASPKKYVYPTDAEALEDFITVHWASGPHRAATQAGGDEDARPIYHHEWCRCECAADTEFQAAMQAAPIKENENGR